MHQNALVVHILQECSMNHWIARVVHIYMHHSGAYLYAPLWCISMCTTLVHIYMHHSGACLYAPLWCISICNTLVHVYMHHSGAYLCAPRYAPLLQFMQHSCNTWTTLAIPTPLINTRTTLPSLQNFVLEKCTLEKGEKSFRGARLLANSEITDILRY